VKIFQIFAYIESLKSNYSIHGTSISFFDN